MLTTCARRQNIRLGYGTVFAAEVDAMSSKCSRTISPPTCLGCGSNAWKAIESALLLLALLLVPGATRVHAQTSRLAWDASVSPDVTGYLVNYGIASGLYTTQVDVGNVTVWDLRGLPDPATTYYISVQAYNSYGALSGYSAEISVTPALVPPLLPSSTDMDGDGRSDVVFQHETTGCMVVWHLNATTLRDQQWLSPTCANPRWRVSGMADFDHDGKQDLLFQNVDSGGLVVWLMNDVSYKQQLWLQPAVVSDPNWRVVALADFDSDSHADLLFQHRADGRIVAWLMTGTALKRQQWLNPGQVSDAAWRIVGTGDADGDAKPDLFFQNSQTGHMVLWIMNGLDLLRQEWVIPNQVDPAWVVSAVGDFDGDALPDLVLQNVTDWRMVVWPLRGNALIRQYWLGSGQASPGWRIVAPR
jgi:hypothetical protein